MVSFTSYSIKFVSKEVEPFTSRVSLGFEVHRTGFINFKERDFSEYRVEITLRPLSMDDMGGIRRKIWLQGPDIENVSTVTQSIISALEPAPSPVQRFAFFKRQVGQVRFRDIKVPEVHEHGTIPDGRQGISYRWEASLYGPKSKRIFRKSPETGLGKFASTRSTMTICPTNNAENPMEIKFYSK